MRQLRFALLCLATGLMPVGSATAQNGPPEQYTLTLETHTLAQTAAFEAAADSRTGATSAQSSSRGKEVVGNCEGRASTASATATAAPGIVGPKSLSAHLDAAAVAAGGHYVLGPCFLRQGQDTTSTALADSTATVHVQFAEHVRPIYYRITFGATPPDAASRSELLVSLVDGKGSPLSTKASDSIEVLGAPSATFTLQVTLRGRASNSGGCCSDNHTASTALHVSLTRAPILARRVRSGRLIPRKPGEVEAYIVGGERVTTGFGAVGALMMDADLDCTGTLVGPVTVLTAAHCVYGREGELPNMSFALGSYAFQPDTSRAVDAFVYPQGENGYRYVDSSLADDIALVYLKDTFPGITPHKLASKTPDVDALAAAKAHPDFVGFGFAMVENSPVGLGYKRHAVIGLGSIEPKRFWYGDPGKNTCNGDSGGPAFVSDETTLSVIGVTSGGAAGCDSGAVDTRVDAYLDWLTPRLR